MTDLDTHVLVAVVPTNYWVEAFCVCDWVSPPVCDKRTARQAHAAHARTEHSDP